jgi:starvation-inducible DNA-binding protein
LATVKEANGEETSEQMVAALAEDFTLLVGELRQGIKIADSIDDEDTADLLLGIKTGLEKQTWMLNAFSGR